MCIDLPRIDYDSNKGKVKKADLDFVKEQNRLSAEKKRIKKLQDESQSPIQNMPEL